MERPFIYFAGDEERCDIIIKSLNKYIQGTFIKGKHITLPKDKFPALICIISKPNANGNSQFLSRLLRYSSAYRCPIYFIGSKHQYLTLLSKCVSTPIYKTTHSNLFAIIRNLFLIYNQHPSDKLYLMKSQFKTVTLSTREASVAAYINGKVNNCPKRDFRMVLNKEFSPIDYSSAFILAEDKNGVLNKDSFRVVKKQTSNPLMITVGFNDKTNLKTKVKHINLSDKDADIIKIVTNYNAKKAESDNVINNKTREHSQ